MIRGECVESDIDVIRQLAHLGETFRPRRRVLCFQRARARSPASATASNIPAPEDEAARWVEEAQRRGIKSIALLTQDYPSIDGHVKALEEEAARRGTASPTPIDSSEPPPISRRGSRAPEPSIPT